MSEQQPPFPKSPIFNSTYFLPSNTVITKAYLDANYLQYPATQGAETFLYPAQFINTVSFFNYVPSTNGTQTYPSINDAQLAKVKYVNDAIANLPPPTPTHRIYNGSGRFQLDTLVSFVLVGYPAGANIDTQLVLPYDGVAIPTGSMMTFRNNTINPVAIYTSTSSTQQLYANSSNTSVSGVGIIAGASLSLIFLQVSTGSNIDGNWYVVGV
jgi:hypothetical protein